MEEEGTFPAIFCHLAGERFVLHNVEWLCWVLFFCLAYTQAFPFISHKFGYSFCAHTELELSLTDSDSDEDVSESEDSAADGDISGDVIDSDDVADQLR